ncbi:MAG: hypothetical protein K2N16_00695 [Muribaculaceae bacterium]|nr:hypothetical protein [Muribaculaceae bacterium]
MRISRILALAAAIALGCAAAVAQNGTMTPYSRYGYGLLNDNATSAQRGMGGVGYAMNSGRQINVMNPASYAAIDSMTFLFDMGVNLDMVWAKEGDTKEDNINGGLDYITLQVPITKWMGASAGLLPFSSTGYSFSQAITNGATRNSGTGGISMAYLGVGVSPFKNAYVGANISYMFGSTVNDVYAYTITGSTSLFEHYTEVKDWHLDLGVQYNINLSDADRLTLGLTYSPAKSLHGETYGVYYDVNSSSSVKVDTVGQTRLHGNYSLPATYGAGVNLMLHNKLMLEADFMYQPWKDAKYAQIEGFEYTEFDNRWRAAVGAQYTPSRRGGYWQRAQYRAGLYYNNDYIKVRGNGIREIGASVGIGLPVPGFRTMLNLAFEYKNRQAHPTPMIKEQYFCVTLGINFNEVWFQKRRIF